MKNTPSTVQPNPAPSTTVTRAVGRPPVVLTADTWEQVTEALVQKSNLTVLADTANVSIPTMRKLLSNRYGHRIKFQRGRSGGVTLISA